MPGGGRLVLCKRGGWLSARGGYACVLVGGVESCTWGVWQSASALGNEPSKYAVLATESGYGSTALSKKSVYRKLVKGGGELSELSRDEQHNEQVSKEGGELTVIVTSLERVTRSTSQSRGVSSLDIVNRKY